MTATSVAHSIRRAAAALRQDVRRRALQLAMLSLSAASVVSAQAARAPHAAAMADSTPVATTESPENPWVGLGIGGASGATGVVLDANFHDSMGPVVGGVVGILNPSSPGFNSEAFVIGARTSDAKVFRMAALGAARVQRTYGTFYRTYETAQGALAVETALHIDNGIAGFSVTAFAAIGPKHVSYWALIFGFDVGSFRRRTAAEGV